MTDITALAEARQLPPPAVRKALRLASGLTLQEVASVIGVTRSAVQRWETGKRTPSGELRVQYAELLGELGSLVGR